MSQSELKKISKSIEDMKASNSERFDNIDKRFEGVDIRFESIDKRFENIDKRFDKVESRMDSLEQRLDLHEHSSAQRFDMLEKKIDKMATQASVDRLANAIDSYVKNTENFMQELVLSLGSRISRLEKQADI